MSAFGRFIRDCWQIFVLCCKRSRNFAFSDCNSQNLASPKPLIPLLKPISIPFCLFQALNDLPTLVSILPRPPYG